jgi:hypothetical protein
MCMCVDVRAHTGIRARCRGVRLYGLGHTVHSAHHLWVRLGAAEMPLCQAQRRFGGDLVPEVQCPADLLRPVGVLGGVKHVLMKDHDAAAPARHAASQPIRDSTAVYTRWRD